MSGNKLGPYELLEELGRGGMATVYRAYQPNVDRFVAVKVIHRSVASDGKSLDRFTREARLIAKLEHPHILPVYDYNGLNDPPYIVMRFLPTGTLKDILERGQLPYHEIAYLMGQIGSALDYAHRQGVIHRDIKPSNIMVDSEGNAFLTDFGIARMVESTGEGLTGTGMAIGTPGYMAPEQGLGMPIDHRADIYALGVMLYELLVGKLPFSAQTPMAVILKHINDPVPMITQSNTNIPPGVDKVIQKAMAKKPEDRYNTASEMARALTVALGPVDDMTPYHLQAAALQTISELESARHDRSTAMPSEGGTPPPARSTGQRRSSGPVTPPPAPAVVQTDTRGGTVQGAVMGAGVVLLLVVLAGAGLLFFSSKGNNDATALAAAGLQTSTHVAFLETQVAASSSAPSQLTPTTGNLITMPTLTQRPAQTPREATTQASTTLKASATKEPTKTVPSTATKAVTVPPTTVSPATTAAATVVAVVASNTAVPPATTTEPTVADAAVQPSETAVPPTRTKEPTATKVPPTATFTRTATKTPIPPTVTFTRTFTATPVPPTATVPSPTAKLIKLSTFTPIPPTATATFTATPVPPTATATSTFSATPVPPTATLTVTPVPPTATFTASPIPPTIVPTAVPPSETPVPPTVTLIPPTPAPVDVTATTAPNVPTSPPATEVASLPLGRMPYVANMESPDVLNQWDFDPGAWKLQSDSGSVSLVGTGGQKFPAVVLAKAAPEWQDPASQNILLSFRVNLDAQASGARIIFRYSEDGGYYVFELIPGLMSVKRGQAGKGLDRGSERIMSQVVNAPIRAAAWYQFQIWADTNRVFVYLNHNLVLSPDDPAQALPGGSILLQTINTNYRVRFSELKIQRPLPASQHFRGTDIPSTWAHSSPTGAQLGTDPKGNGFIEVTSGDVRPINPPRPDMLTACRLWSLQGGFDIRMRESAAGAFQFQFVAGNMNLNQLDSTGKVVQKWPFPNFYGRASFFDFIVETVGNQIRLYGRGNDVFVQDIKNMPPPGDTRFIAVNPGDQFRVGDCLFAETAKSPTEDAAWAFDKIKSVESRPYTPLLSDWYDHFDDKFRTKDWWEGGFNAPGEFKTNPNDPEHKAFLRITYQDGASWRMFRYVKEFYVFGLGQDKSTFFDSSDIYLKVTVRVSKGGTAWIAARTSASLGGGTLDGYRLSLSRTQDDQYTLTASGYSRAAQPTYFQGPLPAPTSSEWLTLLIVTYGDKVAFFANGRYLGSASNIPVLSGTIAVGVDKDSTGDFVDLQLRDVSPETR